MGKLIRFFLLTVFLPGLHFVSAQQLNIPLHPEFNFGTERIFSNSDSLTYHSGFKPLIESQSYSYKLLQLNNKTQKTKHFAWIFKDKNWFKRKMKWENLYERKGVDFYFDINPVFNFEYGRDLANDNSRKFFKNSRGFLINAHLTEKFSFSTSFYENQMYVPLYLRKYATAIGTQRLNTTWKTENPIMPGQGRVKPFKTDAYDFAYATGYFSYQPIKNLNLQFGNGKLFIGEGYRSMLLSDNAFNYPYFRTTAQLFKGKVQYSAAYASLLNVRRNVLFTTPEPLFERKAATFFYLSADITKKIQVGLFEGTMWRRIKPSQELLPINYAYFNPIIGLNTLLNGFKSNDANTLLGVNAKFQPFKKLYFFGQLACDDPGSGKWAYQLGGKWFDPFKIKNLNLQMEIDHAARYMYSAEDPYMSYGHYNQPLAHTSGGGFFEFVAKGYYRTDDYFYELKFNYQTYRYYEGDEQVGKDVYMSDQSTADPALYTSMARVFYKEAVFGYVINPLYNMNLIVGWFHRSIDHIDVPYKTSYLYIGLRTSLSNFYYDI